MTEPTPNADTGRSADPAAPRRRHIVRNGLAVVGVVLGAAVLYLFLRPVAVAAPSAAPAARLDWSEARARIAKIQDAEKANPNLQADCGTRLFDHGGPTKEVVVLFHGYTNCPLQDDVLARQLSDLGYTVYVPLAPEHGGVEGGPSLLGTLTGEALAAYANDSMDTAGGLGERITVMGLSGGGAVAAYIAQFRSDADRVIPIAAFLGHPSVPEGLTPALLNLIGVLPTIDAFEAPPDAGDRGLFPHGMSDTSMQGAAAYMRLAQTVFAGAKQGPPAAGEIIMVSNDADTTVNNAMIESLYRRWAASAPGRVTYSAFDASLGLLHDLITPDRAGAKTEIAYPALIDFVTRP